MVRGDAFEGPQHALQQCRARVLTVSGMASHALHETQVGLRKRMLSSAQVLYVAMPCSRPRRPPIQGGAEQLRCGHAQQHVLDGSQAAGALL